MNERFYAKAQIAQCDLNQKYADPQSWSNTSFTVNGISSRYSSKESFAKSSSEAEKGFIPRRSLLPPRPVRRATQLL